MRGAVVRGVCGVWQGVSAPRDQHFTGDRVVVDQVWSTTDPTERATLPGAPRVI